MFLDIPLLVWKIFYLEKVGILHSAKMKMWIFEPFPA